MQVSDILSSEFGLGLGDLAVNTNGGVVLHKESFIHDDLKLFGTVENDRRIKLVATIIEQVGWEGVDPDDLTSDFLSDAIMVISFAMAIRSQSTVNAHFEFRNAKYSAIILEEENAIIHIGTMINPLSSSGQKLAPLLQGGFQPSLRIVMNTTSSLADLPLKNFYRYYPYHYAPFASDLVGLSQLKITFILRTPFKPFNQLMVVLPAASENALPEHDRPLMTDPNSPIIELYPTDFEIDMNSNCYAWQGVLNYHSFDESCLLAEISKVISKVEGTSTEEEKFEKQ